MKRLLIITLVIALAAALLAGCAPKTENEEQPNSGDPMQYAFELKDINGKTHRLSDYEGKPVYLKIWASWCSVCVSSLPETDALSETAEDYHVLTVISPEKSGEMSLDEFKKWYKELGYKNVTVLVDEEAQILTDFGIQAFPSQVYFDEEGYFVGGSIGQLAKDQIDAAMKNIAAEE